MDAVKTAVGDLVPRVQAGGRKARTALIRLISLATEPNAKTIMQVAGQLLCRSTIQRFVTLS